MGKANRFFSTEFDEIYGSYDKALNEARANILENSSEYRTAGEIPEEKAWDELHFLNECDFDDFSHELKRVDKSVEGPWLIIADIGRWNGRFDGGKVVSGLFDAVILTLQQLDGYTIHEDRYGNLMVDGYHHDGRNYFKIYRLSELGQAWYSAHQWENREAVCRTLDQPRYRRAVHLRRLIDGEAA